MKVIRFNLGCKNSYSGFEFSDLRPARMKSIRSSSGTGRPHAVARLSHTLFVLRRYGDSSFLLSFLLKLVIHNSCSELCCKELVDCISDILSSMESNKMRKNV